MKQKHLLVLSMIVAAGVFTVWSCKKDEDKTVTKADATVIAKNDAVSNAAYNDVYSESESIVSDLESNSYPASGSKKSASLTGSIVITVTKNNGNTTAFPKEITVIYDNYVTNSGIKKNGTIKITQSAKMRESGAIRTVILENFSVNDTIDLEGKVIITNMGLVSEKPTVKAELKDGKVSFDNGYFVTREFTRTITWETGSATLFNIWDDVYSFNETAHGSNSDGLSYSSETSVPLELKVSDFCIKKGKFKLDIEGVMTVYLDFTRETCWDKVKLIIEGDTESFDIW